MIPKENAELVRFARRRLGLSQRAFAAKIGVSYVTVSRWETKGHRLREPVRLAILRLLDEHKQE